MLFERREYLLIGRALAPVENGGEDFAEIAASSYKSWMTKAAGNSEGTDPLLLAVGKRIGRLRQLKKMKPGEFAKAAGVSQQYQWRLEKGQQNVNLRTLAKIAVALGVPMTDLIAGIDPDPAIVDVKRPYVRKDTLPEE